MVGITVVGDDDYFIIVCLGSFNSIFHTFVDGFHCLLDSFVDTGMSHHITIGVVHHDEIELLGLDSFNQLVLHLVRTHFRLQVVSGNLRRRNQDALFSIVGSLAATVEEESHVCILLCFGNVQLGLAIGSKIFAQCVLYILLIKKDMYTLEAGVIRSHAVELQARNGLHALFGHILLGEDNGQFLGTVVTVVEEDYNITFLDGTVEATVHNRLDEFIRNAFVVGLLHSLDHIRSDLPFTVYQQIVGNLHTFPTFVTVHGIETSHDGSNLAGRLLTMGSQLLNEAFTALRVGITTVHKAVDEGILDTVFLGNIAEFEQMVKRAVHATVAGQSHKVDILAVFLCI